LKFAAIIIHLFITVIMQDGIHTCTDIYLNHNNNCLNTLIICMSNYGSQLAWWYTLTCSYYIYQENLTYTSIIMHRAIAMCKLICMAKIGMYVTACTSFNYTVRSDQYIIPHTIILWLCKSNSMHTCIYVILATHTYMYEHQPIAEIYRAFYNHV